MLYMESFLFDSFALCRPLVLHASGGCRLHIPYNLHGRQSKELRPCPAEFPGFPQCPLWSVFLPTACHVQVVLSVGSYYNLSLVIRYTSAFRIGPLFAGRAFEMTVTFLGFFKNVSSLSTMPEKEPPLSCLNVPNIL